MILIGEFAKANNVTIKALHHYEKLGLIYPKKVDDFTAYRYYEKSQSQEIEILIFFKSLGFSLSEIVDIINNKFDLKLLNRKIIIKKDQAILDYCNTYNRVKKLTLLINYLESLGDSAVFNIREVINMSDKITNSKNNEIFVDRRRSILRNSRLENSEMCVLLFDIDNFKKVNDLYGHNAGDIVLDRIINAITNIVIAKSANNILEYALLERDGGDEFILYVNDNLANSEDLAKEILKSIEEIDYGDIDNELISTVSIGIASSRIGGYVARVLLRQADSALLKAKETKNTYSIYT